MAKKGLVDIYKIGDFYSGLGQFSYHLAGELMKQPIAEELDFLVPSRETSQRFIEKGNITFVKAGLQKRYFPQLNPAYAFWHSTQQFPSFLPGEQTPMILTIHDLNFMSGKSPGKATGYLNRLQKLVDRAQVITTISRFTLQEIEKYLNLRGKDVSVIYNGIPSQTSSKASRPAYLGTEQYFFSIGVFKRSKQFHTLLPLMKHFRDHQLVLAGNYNTEYGKEIISLISSQGLDKQVVLPGTISEDEKNWLYTNCDAFLFPSIAEGFGLPLAEAMRAGCPVFSSRYTSLPEIGGETIYYFDNSEIDSMHDVIINGLSDFSRNATLRKQAMKKQADRFSWELSAAGYISLYNELITNHG